MRSECKACPKCGGVQGYLIITPCRGKYHAYHEWENNKFIEANQDDMSYSKEPKTVECIDCKKRIPNPSMGEE